MGFDQKALMGQMYNTVHPLSRGKLGCTLIRNAVQCQHLPRHNDGSGQVVPLPNLFHGNLEVVRDNGQCVAGVDSVMINRGA